MKYMHGKHQKGLVALKTHWPAQVFQIVKILKAVAIPKLFNEKQLSK